MNRDFDREDLIMRMTDNLPTLRASLGITQEDLAKMIGVSRSTIISIKLIKEI